MNKDIFYEDDFSGFLQDLVDSHKLEPMQEGITKLVIDKGYDVLSVKQRKVFDYMIDTFSYDSCERCGVDIPWSEMFDALYNGGYCNYCQHIKEKMADE